MRLATVWMAVEVRYVGTLYAVGVFERGGYTVMHFLLEIGECAPLADYFTPQYGFSQHTLLSSIFEGEGMKVCEPVSENGKRFLAFSREVEGVMREPRKFLHSTAHKLLTELQQVEDCELQMREMDDQLEWAEHDILHPGRRGPMPNFKLPRHV